MGPAPPAGGWADLPRDLLEAVARAVPVGDRLCFRLICRRWAAAWAEVAPEEDHLPRGKVTRTHGADAEASLARAIMVMGVLDGSAWERFESGLCRYSAEDGHIAVLKWARAKGYNWDKYTCAWAARKGQIKVFQ